ncbi:MAG: DNRLRE domain-containing protein [Prevotellaceae bacterium]|jgi:hypothetical protein|nr:DNRLRE domain-containing protein [Prevotellaceae bacterium]
MKKIILLCCAALSAATVSSAAVYYVTPTGMGDQTGESWATAFGNIQAAVTAASSGDEVWVAQGTYTPDATLTWKSGVNVYGGFVGNETAADQRSADASLTILDGSGNKRVLSTGTSALTAASIWSGFTIQNGKNTATGNTAVNGGGGVLMTSNATLENCIVRNNEVTGATNGGGIQVYPGNVTIRNCVVDNNVAGNRGGGIMIGGSSSVGSAGTINIENCIITNNISANADGTSGVTGQGAAISAWGRPSSTTMNVKNCIIVGNKAPGNGGGGWHGTAFFAANGYASNVANVINCTIAKNEGASAIYVYASNNPTTWHVHNNIFWENVIINSRAAKNIDGASSANTYISDLKNNIIAAGSYTSNITPDNTNLTTALETPAIDSAAIFAEDWKLFATSTAVNAGNTTDGKYTPTDITGRALKGSARDIGAYEYVEHITIAAGATVATDYDANTHGDVVFESDDENGTGQWTATATAVTDGVVKLVKTFATGKWYSVGFPFDVAAVSYAGQASYPYQLQSYDKATNLFTPAAAIEAGKGYLIQLPDGLGGSVELTFLSVKNPSIAAAIAPDGYDFVVNPSLANVTSIAGTANYYAFNPSYTGTEDLFSASSDALDALKPFEAVAVTNATSELLTSIGTGYESLKYVTVSKDAGVSLIDVSGEQGYPVGSGNSFSLNFSLLNGYTLSKVTSGEVELAHELSSGVYTVKLDEVTTDTSITIATDTVDLAVSVTADAYVAWQGAAPAATAKYFSDYSFSFTLNDGYHTPYVKVNGAYVSVANVDGVYTVTLTDVREAKSIEIFAFAPHVLPVTDDTHVQDGSANQNTNYNSSGELVVKNDGTGYHRQTYLKFVIPDDISAEQLGEAWISLYLKRANTGVGSVTSWVAYYVDDDSWTENTLTWSNKTAAGDEIARAPTTNVLNTNVLFPVTEKLKAEIGKDRTLSVCIDGSNAVSTGDVGFYPKENTDSLLYIPQLILKQVVAITASSAVTLISPAVLGDNPVPYRSSSYAVSFTVAGGITPEVTVNDDPVSVGDPDEDGVYTLTLTDIVENKTINISAGYSVTVASGAGVTVVSPDGGSPYAVAKDSPFELRFTLNEGYENLQVTMDNSPVTPNLVDGVYTVSIPQVAADVNITIAADAIADEPTATVTVTFAAGAGITIVSSSGSSPYVARYGSAFELRFTLNEGYENLQVMVGSSPVTPDLADGVYTVTIPQLTIPQVTENLTLTISLSATPLSTGISGEDLNDPVVETTYYNLQGQKLREPAITGIYIVRRVHASKKVVAKKELVVKY